MTYFCRLLVLLTFWIIGSGANAGIMSIRVDGPDFMTVVNGGTTVNIYLDGEIDSGAATRLAPILENAKKTGADVYLNSPGGSLLVGMQIGRMIRKAGFNTYVGSGQVVRDPRFDNRGVLKRVPGNCFSACSLAFLGGWFRFMNQGSTYGVHRFSSSVGPTPTDLDSAQIISAAVGAYIREMGVSGELFDYMVQAGKESIRLLSPNELTSLYVVNNGRLRPEWSIEAIEGGVYLRGVQHTLYGEGKVVVFCHGKGALLQSYYQAGRERSNDIASGRWFHSLTTDSATLPLSNPEAIRAVDVWIETTFGISKNYLVAMSESGSIGHAMQLSREAPTFVGFRVDIPKGKDEQKVKSFLRNCAK